MIEATVAIIGGSGLYAIEGLVDVRQIDIETPFGNPSDSIVLGKLSGVPVAFLPRHGRGHHLIPSEIPVRANIYALKLLGVERIISVSAVGSLREDVHPRDIVVPDQIIDRTRFRVGTFFGDGVAVHVGFADPFCQRLSSLLVDTVESMGMPVHRGGTYVVIEGPAFSTKAESHLYRSWGAEIIGMTALPEAKLAREAEMCYSTLACVTDYDCWHGEEEVVNVEMVIKVLSHGVETSKEVLEKVIPQLTEDRDCHCVTALKNAIVTPQDRMSSGAISRLAPIIGKYLS
jgi:5'-methylthioadenosine phosphorylase